jgi:large subunit ribosomal protein L13
MHTVSIRKEDVVRKWYLVDAENQVVGRLASEVAKILRGKHKPFYTPHVDTGDYVIIINADKVVFTGNKWTQKLYRWHTGYPGGLREVSAEKNASAPAGAHCGICDPRDAPQDQAGAGNVP